MFWHRRKDREKDLERELQSHLESEAAEREDAGLLPEEARYAARRALGNATLLKENVREIWVSLFFDRLKQDLSYALRGLRKNPVFTATAVLSLALGIGANTAIFSLIDALLLRSLPVRAPQELVQLTMLGRTGQPHESFSYPLVQALAAHSEIFSGLCGFSATSTFTVGAPGSLEPTPGAWVTGEYYETLGIFPAAGRLLTRDDDRPGAVPVAVITDGYWKRKFGRDPGAIGQPILIAGKPVIIAGVTPAGFKGANVGEAADLTLPLGVIRQLQSGENSEYALDTSSWWLRVLARPHPGISQAELNARLRVIWPRIVESVVNDPGSRRRVEGSTLENTAGGSGWTDLRRQFRQPLLVLMAVVGLLLLIACANVANLLLARATARQKEIAVRLAIGAGRARIVRQLLTESAVLSFFGAAAALALAWFGGRFLITELSSGQARALTLDVSPNWHVLAVTSVAAIVAGFVFGIVPALRGTNAGPAAAFKDQTAGSRYGLARLLVISQVSLSFLLLIGAGLFVRTLQNLRHLDPGFQRNGVLLAHVDGTQVGYSGARLAEFYLDLLQKVQPLPGVTAASFSLITPLSGGGISQSMKVNGQPTGQEEIYFNAISPRYFETMGTPVLLGREFTVRDSARAPLVGIVNETFAKHYLHEGSPIGQRLTLATQTGTGFLNQEFDVVGMVRDAVYESLREAPPPTVYVPLIQRIRGGIGVTLEVRASGSLAQVASALRKTLQPSFPNTPVEVQAFTAQVEQMLVEERLMASLAAAFGILGLALAAIGLYGLLAYKTARRTSEIGIRMALGARRSEVLRLVIEDAFSMLCLGVAGGLAAAWAASRFVSSMLFGLTATDPSTIGIAVAVLGAAGLLAGFLPAWRASHLDPMAALRHE
jgi:predicted permease